MASGAFFSLQASCSHPHCIHGVSRLDTKTTNPSCILLLRFAAYRVGRLCCSAKCRRKYHGRLAIRRPRTAAVKQSSPSLNCPLSSTRSQKLAGRGPGKLLGGGLARGRAATGPPCFPFQFDIPASLVIRTIAIAFYCLSLAARKDLPLFLISSHRLDSLLPLRTRPTTPNRCRSYPTPNQQTVPRVRWSRFSRVSKVTVVVSHPASQVNGRINCAENVRDKPMFCCRVWMAGDNSW
ncbi:hypothetical protein B0H67DRAFT_1284 [Lasiosphaeris hirsuta]|uniref:Uncharacterized protein n=1 Tax=Lasiosphaeris hirsuta TaxID=260670 RepID=A0AA40B8B2_9PEZI|nr:hypothetical protein B0H67DRAFT_1284 [Lasiosphaeris hirsuta]